MTDRDLHAAYDDLLEATDDPRMWQVVRDLEIVYPRVQPPPGLANRLRTLAAQPRKQRPFSRAIPRRPAVLGLAALLSAAVAGGGGYAMHLFGGSSQVHLASRCAGTALTIAAPAFQVSSPQQFVAEGGRLVPQGIKAASRLPHPQYWVIPADADIVNTCRFESVNQVEVGTNARHHTVLEAISVVAFSQANRPWPVGSLLIPGHSDCPVRTTNRSIAAPDHRPVAQLAHVPPGLARTIAVTLPPCVSKRPVRTPAGLPPPSERISFLVLSQVRYRGPEGTVVVLTAQPSPAALRPGLYLGNRVGRLPDGSTLFDLPCQGDCPRHDVRWLRKGLIISVSGDVPLGRLRALASDVVVR
jgi:hypothetical protein